MILTTLAAMADYANNGKYDHSATQAEILAKMQEMTAAGKLTAVEETLTIGSQTVKVRTSEGFAIAAEAIQNKTSEQIVAGEIIDLKV